MRAAIEQLIALQGSTTFQIGTIADVSGGQFNGVTLDAIVNDFLLQFTKGTSTDIVSLCDIVGIEGDAVAQIDFSKLPVTGACNDCCPSAWEQEFTTLKNQKATFTLITPGNGSFNNVTNRTVDAVSEGVVRLILSQPNAKPLLFSLCEITAVLDVTSG